VASGLKQSN
jgi:hypothetical protein